MRRAVSQPNLWDGPAFAPRVQPGGGVYDRFIIPSQNPKAQYPCTLSSTDCLTPFSCLEPPAGYSSCPTAAQTIPRSVCTDSSNVAAVATAPPARPKTPCLLYHQHSTPSSTNTALPPRIILRSFLSAQAHCGAGRNPKPCRSSASSIWSATPFKGASRNCSGRSSLSNNLRHSLDGQGCSPSDIADSDSLMGQSECSTNVDPSMPAQRLQHSTTGHSFNNIGATGQCSLEATSLHTMRPSSDSGTFACHSIGSAAGSMADSATGSLAGSTAGSAAVLLPPRYPQYSGDWLRCEGEEETRRSAGPQQPPPADAGAPVSAMHTGCYARSQNELPVSPSEAPISPVLLARMWINDYRFSDSVAQTATAADSLLTDVTEETDPRSPVGPACGSVRASHAERSSRQYLHQPCTFSRSTQHAYEKVPLRKGHTSGVLAHKTPSKMAVAGVFSGMHAAPHACRPVRSAGTSRMFGDVDVAMSSSLFRPAGAELPALSAVESAPAVCLTGPAPGGFPVLAPQAHECNTRCAGESSPPRSMLHLRKQESPASSEQPSGRSSMETVWLERKSLEASFESDLMMRVARAQQTMNFAARQRAALGALNITTLGLWDALRLLDSLGSLEEKPGALSPLSHAMLCAQWCAHEMPQHEWAPLIGLIHSLGHLLSHTRFGAQPAWAVRSESYPLGCKSSEAISGHVFLTACPDRRCSAYATPTGVYSPHCGLDATHFTWTAAEYLSHVVAGSDCQLPFAARFLLRYQGFESAITQGAYGHLMSAADEACMPALRRFAAMRRAAAAGELGEPTGGLSQEEVAERCSRLFAKYFPSGVLRF